MFSQKDPTDVLSMVHTRARWYTKASRQNTHVRRDAIMREGGAVGAGPDDSGCCGVVSCIATSPSAGCLMPQIFGFARTTLRSSNDTPITLPTVTQRPWVWQAFHQCPPSISDEREMFRRNRPPVHAECPRKHSTDESMKTFPRGKKRRILPRWLVPAPNSPRDIFSYKNTRVANYHPNVTVHCRGGWFLYNNHQDDRISSKHYRTLLCGGWIPR